MKGRTDQAAEQSWKAIARLVTEKAANVLRMRSEGKTNVVIAQEVNCGQGTIPVILERAADKLREAAEEQERFNRGRRQMEQELAQKIRWRRSAEQVQQEKKMVASLKRAIDKHAVIRAKFVNKEVIAMIVISERQAKDYGWALPQQIGRKTEGVS